MRDQFPGQRPAPIRSIAGALLGVWLLLLTLPAAGAQTAVGLRITGVDPGGFPDVAVTVAGETTDGALVADWGGLSLSEDGAPVGDFTSEPAPLPLEVTFVLDANPASLVIDEAGGLPRWQKAFASIERFATREMAPGDRVSVLVPEGAGGRFLVESSDDPVAIQAALEGYVPEPPDLAPLGAMLGQAVEGVAAGEDGRLRLLLLYTDGASLAEQLDFEQLVEQAGNAGVVYYAAILGQRADPNEVANVARLYEPTGGAFRHLPAAEDADTLFAGWRAAAQRQRIVYRSQVTTSGEHTIAITLDETSASSTFVVTVLPPAVTPTAAETTIRRSAAAGDSGPPALHPLLWRVTWPDGHPRLLEGVTLLVDGREQPPARPPTLNGDILTVDWGIETLGEGTYALQVRLVDELGLETTSERVPMTIEIEEEPAEPVVEDAATALPAETVVSDAVEEAPDAGLPGLALPDDRSSALLAALGAGVVAVLGLLFWRRRRARQLPAAPPPPHAGEPLSFPGPAGVTTGPVPAGTAPAGDVAPVALAPSAYLVTVDGGTAPWELAGERWTLGSDPAQADVVLRGGGIAPVHARITRQGERYFLTDADSTTGTYLNFERLGLAPRELEEGDDVHLGRLHLRFFFAKEAAMSAYEGPETGGLTGHEWDESHYADTRPLRPVALPDGEPAPGRRPPVAGAEDDDLSAQFADTGPLPAISPAVLAAMADLEANEAAPADADEMAATIAAVDSVIDSAAGSSRPGAAATPGETYDESYFADTGPLPALRPTQAADEYDPFADTGPLPAVKDEESYFADTRPLRPVGEAASTPAATWLDDESE